MRLACFMAFTMAQIVSKKPWITPGLNVDLLNQFSSSLGC